MKSKTNYRSITARILPKKARRALLTTSSKEKKAVIYLDSNCLAPLLFLPESAPEWRHFIALLGGDKIIDRQFKVVLSVLHFAEILGLRPPNAQLSWNRPKGDHRVVYNAALEHGRTTFLNALDEKSIEVLFQEIERKLVSNPLRPVIERWLRNPPNKNNSSRAEAFRSTLAEHWTFHFIQIAELYGDQLFRQVIPSIFYSAMMNRSNGDEVAIYRAIQKDIRIFCRLVRKQDLKDHERDYFESLEASLPEFKDRGDDVDSELIHYAITGATFTGDCRAVTLTLDPDEQKMRSRLRFARGHYEYLLSKTIERFPDYAKAFHPGWVVMLKPDFSVREIIDVDLEVDSWMRAKLDQAENC